MMQATEVSQEIIELEHEYWRAMRDKDARAAQALTDDQCVLTGSSGVTPLDRAKFEQMLASDVWTLHEYVISDALVRQLSDDVAVIAYKVRERMTVEGKPLTLEAADASTWVRRDGRWLCALHTESILGDPFGRDRLQAKQQPPR
jgi:uncharacterized protein (TIGR02246 family)